MNLWLRLIWLFLSARWRPPLTPPDGVSVLRFRVLPHDLDLSLHMNNGRYLTIMDLGRIDLIVRLGLWQRVVAQRWTPVANAVLIRFRRELRPFARYRLETRIVGWGDVAAILEQVFVIEGGPRDGQVAARALVKGGFYDRAARDYVQISRLMAEIGVSAEAPAASEEVKAFLAADGVLREAEATPG